MKFLILSSQSAIGQYEEALPSLHFSGPTQLAPMLEKAAALAESQNMSQNKQVYTVLLVITVSINRFFMSFFILYYIISGNVMSIMIFSKLNIKNVVSKFSV